MSAPQKVDQTQVPAVSWAWVDEHVYDAIRGCSVKVLQNECRLNVDFPFRGIDNSAREPERGIPWAEWRAATLNHLFQEQGVTGQTGHITAATIRHGEAGRERESEHVSAVDCAATDEQSMSRAETTE